MASSLNPAKYADNLRTAQQALEKGDKKASKSVLRWKPDWEQAARWYREAEKYFRYCGEANIRDLFTVLKKSAIAHEGINSFHTAAAALEDAAQIAQEKLNLPAHDVAELYRESYRLYRLNNSTEKAVVQNAKAAEALGNLDLDKSFEYHSENCTLYEDGTGKPEFAEPSFKKAIIFAVKKERYEKAIEFMKLQNTVIQKISPMGSFEEDIYKNYLSILILRFHLQQYEKGIAEFQEHEADSELDFGRSDQCEAGNLLIEAYNGGSNEVLIETLKLAHFKVLLSPIAQLARKLRFPDSVVQLGDRRQFADLSDDDNIMDFTGATAQDDDFTGGAGNSSKASAAAAAIRQPRSFDEPGSEHDNVHDEEDYDHEDIESAPAPKPKKSKKTTKKAPVDEDDEYEVHEDIEPENTYVPPSKTTKRQKEPPPSYDEVIAEEAQAPNGKSKSKSKPKSKVEPPPTSTGDEDANYDEEGIPAPVSRKPSKPKKLVPVDSEDDTSTAAPSKIKTSKVKSPPASSNPFGDDDEDEQVAAPVTDRPKSRGKAETSKPQRSLEDLFSDRVNISTGNEPSSNASKSATSLISSLRPNSTGSSSSASASKSSTTATTKTKAKSLADDDSEDNGKSTKPPSKSALNALLADDDDDEVDDKANKTKAKKKKTKKTPPQDDSSSGSADPTESLPDNNNDNEANPPKKSSKKTRAVSSNPFPEDEDQEEAARPMKSSSKAMPANPFPEDDDEQPQPPRVKKSSKKNAAAAAANTNPFPEDDENDQEPEPSKPKKKASKIPPSTNPFPDEDEEGMPKQKKTVKKKPAPAANPFDEDDEPASRPATSTKSKRPQKDDDDFT